jgi:predicted nicotinamide N-methyase
MPPALHVVAAAIGRHTRLVPTGTAAIALRLITPECPLWRGDERGALDAFGALPFWAFLWPGGYGIMRYLESQPLVVSGRRVYDFGAGSGCCALAAARLGAELAVANDIDPTAGLAAAMNAWTNGVRAIGPAELLAAADSGADTEVGRRRARAACAQAGTQAEGTVLIDCEDRLGSSLAALALSAHASQLQHQCNRHLDHRGEPSSPPRLDVVLAGDVCYDPAFATTAVRWLLQLAAGGAEVYLGDPGRVSLREALTAVLDGPPAGAGGPASAAAGEGASGSDGNTPTRLHSKRLALPDTPGGPPLLLRMPVPTPTSAPAAHVTVGLDIVAEYGLPPQLMLESSGFATTSVWRMAPAMPQWEGRTHGSGQLL